MASAVATSFMGRAANVPSLSVPDQPAGARQARTSSVPPKPSSRSKHLTGLRALGFDQSVSRSKPAAETLGVARASLPRSTLVTALAYAWAAPTTVVGLALAGVALASGGRVRRADGVLEATAGWLDPLLRRAVPLPGGADAMALGHVVLGRDAASLDRHRAHERVHVRQCERWGPLFVPAYLLASAWARLRSRDAYRDNPFEREARGADRVAPPP